MTGPRVVQHELLTPRGRAMEMPGVGVLRDVRSFSGRCTAEPVDGRVREFTVDGVFRRVYRASEPSGAEVGEYRREKALRRDGALSWYGVEYRLVQNGTWRPVYALRRADRDLLTLKPYSIGPRRVSARPTGLEPVEPGLELFCAWLVFRFSREDASAAAAGG